MRRLDLDWQFGGMATEETLTDWLDRAHPVEYGHDQQGRYVWGNFAQALPADRFRRCPTCEEWAPCSVRVAVLALAQPEART